jgi:hypothetical protein
MYITVFDSDVSDIFGKLSVKPLMKSNVVFDVTPCSLVDIY